MNTYIISYDLHKPELYGDYANLIKAIKTANFWAKPLYSVWIVKSPLTAMEISNRLLQYIDRNDSLLVYKLDHDWAGFNLPVDVANWLNT